MQFDQILQIILLFVSVIRFSSVFEWMYGIQKKKLLFSFIFCLVTEKMEREQEKLVGSDAFWSDTANHILSVNCCVFFPLQPSIFRSLNWFMYFQGIIYTFLPLVKLGCFRFYNLQTNFFQILTDYFVVLSRKVLRLKHLLIGCAWICLVMSFHWSFPVEHHSK